MLHAALGLFNHLNPLDCIPLQNATRLPIVRASVIWSCLCLSLRITRQHEAYSLVLSAAKFSGLPPDPENQAANESKRQRAAAPV